MISPSEIISLGALLVLSAFFSGAEVALLSVHRTRIERFVSEKRPGSRALQRLVEHPRRMIVTILIGNNVVNVAASALTTVLAERAFGSSAIGIAAGALTLTLLVFGEITPKSLAQANAGRIALLIARPIGMLQLLLFPLVVVLERFTAALQKTTEGLTDDEQLDALTESEIQTMVRFGVDEEIIEPEEQYIINRAMRFSDTTVDQVMTPTHRVFGLEAHLPASAVIDSILESGYSRIPVFRGDLQNVVGLVLLKEVVRARVENESRMLEELAHEPIFIAPGTPIDDVFKIFQKKRMHMGIIRDADQGVLGIATLEDLLEELVGEIDDETDKTLNPQDGLEEVTVEA